MPLSQNRILAGANMAAVYYTAALAVIASQYVAQSAMALNVASRRF